MIKLKQKIKRIYLKEKEDIIFLLSITVLLLLFQTFFFRIVIVSGDSMEPNFHNNEIEFLDQRFYKEQTIDRFDVVIIKQKHRTIIKRVIGKPNETVQIKNGYVYINDKKLNTDIKTEIIEDPGMASTKIHLGNDEYFVLGDNRNHSLDSRYKSIGIIKKDQIQGAIINFSKKTKK